MKLLTEELKKRFKVVGSQKEVEDPIIITKFFNPSGHGTWYATEYNQKEKMFFGYVSLFGDHNDEWGYFSLEELEDFTSTYSLKIERDLYFGEKLISEVKK